MNKYDKHEHEQFVLLFWRICFIFLFYSAFFPYSQLHNQESASVFFRVA